MHTTKYRFYSDTSKHALWVRAMLALFVLSMLVVIVGCEQSKHSQSARTATHSPTPMHMYEYKVHQSDDSWLFYYFLFTSMQGHTNVYYATSPQEVGGSYRTLSFQRSSQEVEAAIANSTQIAANELVKEESLPEAMKSEFEAAYQEYAETQNQLDHDTNASENPAPPGETSPVTESNPPAESSSDASASGGDSGSTSGDSGSSPSE